MACREILCYPDPRLKAVCAPVATIDDHVRQVAEDLRDTLCAAVGTGIAAPQIGELIRVIYVDSSRNEKYAAESHGPLTLVNPRILAQSGTRRFREGCLSLPQFTATVKRAKTITVVALALDGAPVRLDFDGFEAVLLQHEIDHLDGVLFIDRADERSSRLRRPDGDS